MPAIPPALLNLLATPTADQVFKSMGESMSSKVNPLHILGAVAVLIGTLVLLSLVTRRRDPRQKTRSLNNPARLIREMSRQAGLKPRELKQLKQIAAEQKIDNPLVLLICPSVLKKAMSERHAAKR